MKVWRRLFGFMLPYKGALVVALVAMTMLALTTGLYPILLELLTTLLIEGPEKASRSLLPMLSKLEPVTATLGLSAERIRAYIQTNVLVLFGAVVSIKAFSQAARFFSMGWIAQRVIQDLRAKLFASIVRQGATFFGSQATGFLVSRVMNDVTQVERAATYAIPVLIGDSLKVLVLATVCALQYPELSVVSLVLLPVAVLPIVQFGRMLKRYAKRSQHALGGLTNRITETLGGIRVVHTYGREAHEIDRFAGESEGYVRTMMKSVFVRAVQTPAMELIGVLVMLLTLGYAIDKVETGAVRPGEVVGFLLALVLLYEPLKAVGRLNGIIMPGVAAAERVYEIIDRVPEIQDAPDAVALSEAPKLVRYRGVSFAYEADKPVVRDVDFSLPKGQMIALVGPSGSGKSTLAALLPRLFDLRSGSIELDGQDIRKLKLQSLRAQIAMVLQETYLFNDTIRANIAYSRPDATLEQIEDAAKKAFAHDFIQGLPKGYDTVTGERGAQLSGGQRQRIAIARAFLRDAPILILDEATSALDTESEREVQAALDALLKDRTALVIAHRLSTVRRADEILYLEQGRITERGDHEALLQKSGAYARLVRMQEEG